MFRRAELAILNQQRGGVVARVAVFMAVLFAIGGGALFLFSSAGSIQRSSAPTTSTALRSSAKVESEALPAAGIVGWIDSPALDTIVGDVVSTEGWALASKGVRGVDIVIDGRVHAADYGLPRPDVAIARPGYPDAGVSGFRLQKQLSPSSVGRHVIEYVVTDRTGTNATFGRRVLISGSVPKVWGLQLDARPGLESAKFYFLMMVSGVASGAATEVVGQYKDYVSRTQKVGIAVPILYLRTTKGAKGDWKFAPDFDTSLRCGEKPVAEDNLQNAIEFAKQKNVPIQFVLNGGIWADSSCSTPEWDLTDHLEEEVENCQWSQNDEVFPDDLLKGLAGSTESPQLTRALTYSIYASKVRAYKKRNLQAAARIIAEFARQHPDLFVGVALDSDTSMISSFLQKQIFDYNPGMIRQFREWLQGTGPYAGGEGKGSLDLSRYRRERPLTLMDASRLAQQHWNSWDEVQPPRRIPTLASDWNDPWWQTWDAFRKHVVKLHYDELSMWVHEMGIAQENIFSAQGFVSPDASHKPFAVRVDSVGQNYDSAGVSVEGAVPKFGHLGAILYGKAARNDAPMETPHSLFATFARVDDSWAIVEYNNAELDRPSEAPSYSAAYKTFRDAFNYGARRISAMAWNGSNGLNIGNKGFVGYTAWRNTGPEDAMRDFLLAHWDVPSGAQLWTFGTPHYATDDGWTVVGGTMDRGGGFLKLKPEAQSLTLVSPSDLVIRPERIDSAMFRFGEGSVPTRISVSAQLHAGDGWVNIGSSASSEVALEWPVKWLDGRTIVSGFKIEINFERVADAVTLAGVLLYPTLGLSVAERAREMKKRREVDGTRPTTSLGTAGTSERGRSRP